MIIEDEMIMRFKSVAFSAVLVLVYVLVSRTHVISEAMRGWRSPGGTPASTQAQAASVSES